MVAVLNLESEVEKEVNSAFFRMHTGRWPLFRCHGMRRVGDALVELAEWYPTRIRFQRARYSIVEWSLTSIAMCWRDFPSLRAARSAFKATVGNDVACYPAASATAQPAP